MEPNAQSLQQIKDSQRATWMSGDFGVVAKTISGNAEVRALPSPPARDVASGNPIPLARAGAIVTGRSPPLPQARERAASEGLAATFDEGCRQLPYPDASFDAVFTMFGAMFAPALTSSGARPRPQARRPPRDGPGTLRSFSGLSVDRSGPGASRLRGSRRHLRRRRRQQLPYPDASFDTVVTMFGAMFAPRPDGARPRPQARRPPRDGKLEPCQLLRINVQSRRQAHPTPSHCPSTRPWGDETTVRRRLGPHFTGIETQLIPIDFDLPTSPAGAVELLPHLLRPQCTWPTSVSTKPASKPSPPTSKPCGPTPTSRTTPSTIP